MKRIFIISTALVSSMAFAQTWQTQRHPQYNDYHDNRAYHHNDEQSMRQQEREKMMALNRVESGLVNDRQQLDNQLRQRQINQSQFNIFAKEYDHLISKTRYLKSKRHVSWQEIEQLNAAHERIEKRIYRQHGPYNQHNRWDKK